VAVSAVFAAQGGVVADAPEGQHDFAAVVSFVAVASVHVDADGQAEQSFDISVCAFFPSSVFP
jgi:hypothetical protein